MKIRSLLSVALGVITLGIAPPASADVIYFGLQNIPIPTNFDGVYLNIDTGATSTSEFTGWDINPFFGGTGVANSPAFQPARIGTGNEDRIIALGANVTVGGGLNYSSGYGGSSDHIGAGSDQFHADTQAYLGFKFTTDASAGPYYGWMRVIFNPNTSGGMIFDWAYETSGGSTVTGNILQAAPVSGVSLVTLTAGSGETPALGSVLADGTFNGNPYVMDVEKVGSGTWSLNAANTYTGTTTITGGTLQVGNGGTTGTLGTGNVVNNATLAFNRTNAMTVGNAISGSGVVNQVGSGTTTLTGASTYTGATTVSAGTLSIDNNNTTTARLGGTTNITVNSGGTLLLAQSGGTASTNRINDSATITLNGGTLNTGGLSERNLSGSTVTPGVGALTLQASSVINMGAGSSILALANSSAASWSGTLSIYNWSGNAITGNGTDQLFFGTDTSGLDSTQLGQVVFYSDNGVTQVGFGSAIILSTGEVVPVPEPATWIAGALACAFAGWSQRRRLAPLLKRAA